MAILIQEMGHAQLRLRGVGYAISPKDLLHKSKHAVKIAIVMTSAGIRRTGAATVSVHRKDSALIVRF